MKTRFKSIFNLFMLLTLLTIFASTSPAISAQAESLDRPLYANGDFVWAKSIAGSFSYGYDEGRSIVTDTNNNIYTTGFLFTQLILTPAQVYSIWEARGGPTYLFLNWIVTEILFGQKEWVELGPIMDMPLL